MFCCDFGPTFLLVIGAISVALILPGVAVAAWCVRDRRYARALLALVLPVPAGWLTYQVGLDFGIYGVTLVVLMLASATISALAVALSGRASSRRT
mgnify:CR=1 FL=1